MPSNCTCDDTASALESLLASQSGTSSNPGGVTGFWFSVAWNVFSTLVAAGLAYKVSRTKSTQTHSVISENVHTVTHGKDEKGNPTVVATTKKMVTASIVASQFTESTSFKIPGKNSHATGGAREEEDSKGTAGRSTPLSPLPNTPALKAEAIKRVVNGAQQATDSIDGAERKAGLDSVIVTIADPAHAAAASLMQRAAGAALKRATRPATLATHDAHDEESTTPHMDEVVRTAMTHHAPTSSSTSNPLSVVPTPTTIVGPESAPSPTAVGLSAGDRSALDSVTAMVTGIDGEEGHITNAGDVSHQVEEVTVTGATTL